MITTVRDRADIIATYRFTSVFLMETLARWVPTTPELEVKILMGRHIWEFAQHADLFGRRTNELRTAMHYTRQPVGQYLEALETLAAGTATGDRIDGFYDVVLVDLATRYRAYLDQTDTMADEPSVRILERILTDVERMRHERDAMRAGRPELPVSHGDWLESLRTAVTGVRDIVSYRTGQE